MRGEQVKPLLTVSLPLLVLTWIVSPVVLMASPTVYSRLAGSVSTVMPVMRVSSSTLTPKVQVLPL